MSERYSLAITGKETPTWQPKPAPLVWGTCVGAWGDAILDLGTFKGLVGRGGIIYYGYDPNLAEFIGAQSFVDAVIHVEPGKPGCYRKFCDDMWKVMPGWDKGMLNFLRTRAGLKKVNVVNTSLNWERNRHVVHRWHGARLPPLEPSEPQKIFERRYISWSNPARSCGQAEIDAAHTWDQRYYILHPYSFNTSTQEQHWPHWETAIEYLLGYTPWTYVLTGQGFKVNGEHPRLVNLVGQTRTMMDVFALAEGAAGVISTANSLSHYAAVQGINAVICGNQQLMDAHSPFRPFIEVPSIRLVNWNEGIGRFVQVVNEVV